MALSGRYQLKNTLSDNGGVTRGVCTVEDGKLVGIKETKNIIKAADGAEAYREKIDINALVSMNFWCYTAAFMEVLKKDFLNF